MRKFKQAKRAEFRDVLKAFDVFSLGCAYAPGYPDLVREIEEKMEELQTLLTIKKWGR